MHMHYEVTYLNYIGDGDCNTFKTIVEKNQNVLKKECIDPMQKRKGSQF